MYVSTHIPPSVVFLVSPFLARRYNANNYLSECSTPSRALLQNVVDTMEPSGTEDIDVLSVLIDFQIRL